MRRGSISGLGECRDHACCWYVARLWHLNGVGGEALHIPMVALCMLLFGTSMLDGGDGTNCANTEITMVLDLYSLNVWHIAMRLLE